MFDKLGFFGNYTYQESKVDEPDDKPSVFWLDDLPPKHKINIGLRYKLFENTLLTCDTRYVGEKKGESGDSIDAFTTTDIGVQQTILKKTKLLVYVNNVFGESYQEVYGYPRPRQTFGVQIKHTF